MKILQIITGLDYGGAEKVVLDLCLGYLDRGHEVLCVSLSNKKAMLAVFKEAGIEVIPLQIKKNPLSLFRGWKQLRQIIRNREIQVVHAHMLHAMLFSGLLSLSGNYPPLIYTPHNFLFGKRHRKYLIKYLKFLRTRDILFSRDHYSSLFKKDFVVIPNGIKIPPDKKKMDKFSEFTFLVVGRLEVMKNHKALIPIALQLLEQKRNFKILIAGDGTLRSELETLIHRYKLEENISLLGLRKDIRDLCRRSHAFLMPSLWEGMPISILEAASTKLPVITTPVGSIPTLIDKESGYMGELSDFPLLMSKVMDSYAVAEAKAQRLYDKVKKEYSMDHILDLHLKLYEDCMAGHE